MRRGEIGWICIGRRPLTGWDTSTWKAYLRAITKCSDGKMWKRARGRIPIISANSKTAESPFGLTKAVPQISNCGSSRLLNHFEIRGVLGNTGYIAETFGDHHKGT